MLLARSVIGKQMLSTSKQGHKHSAIKAIESRADPLHTSSRTWRIIKIAAVSIFTLTTGVVLNIIQIICSPLRLFAPRLSHRLNCLASEYAWNLCQYMVEGQDNAKISLSGLEDIPREESAIVICNHAYFGDFYLIHALATKRGMLPSCRYFIKDSIKYIPVFGWGMKLCNFPFLKRNWARDSARITQVLDMFINYKLPVWLISHVEGSRISKSKLEASHKFARENNLPLLQNVLIPRCKGFMATISALRKSHVKYVYDITVAYYHAKRGFCSPPTLWDILTGNLDDYQLHAHIDRIPITTIPSEEGQVTKWLYDLYLEKDSLLEDIKIAFESRDKKH